ncbi:GLPGLI family protein [Chryseobacterium wanjuense]|uniref:GLPGLI family protein n=1 Tax=Chryseobacterium wanjuense TaxID=356305 RepID=A0A1I0RD26_9FLAO|nr:GLPGLI family protein [Chryseobacterium wanjuense]SEW38755.1 GLPGLI family protein [Chryseobacterium wanjuense]
MKILFFLLFSSFYLGQGVSFIYEVKYRTNVNKSDDYNTTYMSLDLAEKKSIFRENIDKKADSIKIAGGNPMLSSGFENQFYVKKDLSSNQVNKILTNGQYNFILPIDDILNWKILSEKKKIGVYNVQKATVIYGEREWIAWFTSDIPINDGPYVFRGLPGLIVSIKDNTDDYNFNLIQTKNSTNLFDARVKGSNIDWIKFKELSESYYQNPYPELRQGGTRKVTFIDKDGNSVDVDVQRKKMTTERQNYINNNNNPIELNHKINY